MTDGEAYRPRADKAGYNQATRSRKGTRRAASSGFVRASEGDRFVSAQRTGAEQSSERDADLRNGRTMPLGATEVSREEWRGVHDGKKLCDQSGVVKSFE